jgi:WD40 repeat protein
MLTSRGDITCGVWRYPPNSSKPTYQELLGYSETDGALVTALAWEPSGSLLAVATCTQGFGELHLFDGRSLDLLETLPASQRAILKLQFQGLRLAGLAPYDDESESSTILLWNLANGLSAEPQSFSAYETLEDMDFVPSTPHGAIFAAGGDVIYEFSVCPELQYQGKLITTPHMLLEGQVAERWAFVKASPQRGPGDEVRKAGEHFVVAASSETGTIHASPYPDHFKRDAHQGPITGLQKRPTSAHKGIFEFATSSEDGSVKVWSLQYMGNWTGYALLTLAKFTSGQPTIMKTLSYSPDGFCLAAASNSSMRVWNAENGYSQVASWQGPAEWKGNHIHDDDSMSNGAMSGVNGDGMTSTADHSLSWNPDSKKIAFGLGSQVSRCQLR